MDRQLSQWGIVGSALLLMLACSPKSSIPVSRAPSIPEEAVSKSALQVKDVDILPSRSLEEILHDTLSLFISSDTAALDHFVGFHVHDIESNKELFSYNGDKHFTPASNLKLFTYYAGLKHLDEKAVGLRYCNQGDSLIIQGTADPSFLYDEYAGKSKVVDFLKSAASKIYLDLSNDADARYGSGWAWDDYPYYYQAEKSVFPIYGNVLGLNKAEGDSTVVYNPKFFEWDIKESSDSLARLISRDPISNTFEINQKKISEAYEIQWRIPFKYDPDLLVDLLSDTTDHDIRILQDSVRCEGWREVRSIEMDSLYRSVLIDSDNFVAEQIILMISQKELGYVNTRAAIRYLLENTFRGLPDKMRWSDGSGLSRYNLVTPRNLTWLLRKISEDVPIRELKKMLPQGRPGDTLDDFFYNPDDPWIFAKTGTLSNNFNVSGYMITKSGKLLAFSSMHNHFLSPRVKVARKIHEKLKLIRDLY